LIFGSSFEKTANKQSAKQIFLKRLGAGMATN